MNIKYLGHSAFEIKINNDKLLIDPFLVNCPNYKLENIKAIFVTHGHGDHLGNAIEISKQTKAPIVAVFELANYCASKGANTIDVSFGSWINFEWGKVVLTPAFHSSSTNDGIYTGEPCGFIFNIENKIIYHAGDTNLNSEMKIIGEIYKPDVAMLPIGGKYTMDIEHSIIASEWLNTQNIIPMHYNTFDAIKIDIREFEEKINKINKKPIILNVNEIFTI